MLKPLLRAAAILIVGLLIGLSPMHVNEAAQAQTNDGPATSAKKSPQGPLVARPSSVLGNQKVRLAGRLQPRARHRVQLQINTGEWRTIRRTMTTRTGKFSFVDRAPSAAGTVRYRVRNVKRRGQRYVKPTRAVAVRVLAPWIVTRVTNGNDYSYSGAPDMDNDANLLAFESSASNLVANDDGGLDVFAWRPNDRTIRKLPTGDYGSRWPRVSGNGRYVAYTIRLDEGQDRGARVWNSSTGETEDFPGHGYGLAVVDISTSGQYVLLSESDNRESSPARLVLWDRTTSQVTSVTESASHYDQPALSGDGSTVVFSEDLPGFREGYDLIAWDRESTRTSPIARIRFTHYPDWGATSVSEDGSVIAFHADQNVVGVTPPGGRNDEEIYKWTRESSKTVRLTRESENGGFVGLGGPILSGDGQTLMFNRGAMQVWNLGTGEKTELRHKMLESSDGSLSHDGRFATFSAAWSGFVDQNSPDGDTDVIFSEIR